MLDERGGRGLHFRWGHVGALAEKVTLEQSPNYDEAH
jgi:hypothetical protein